MRGDSEGRPEDHVEASLSGSRTVEPDLSQQEAVQAVTAASSLGTGSPRWRSDPSPTFPTTDPTQHGRDTSHHPPMVPVHRGPHAPAVDAAGRRG